MGSSLGAWLVKVCSPLFQRQLIHQCHVGQEVYFLMKNQTALNGKQTHFELILVLFFLEVHCEVQI